MGFESWVLYVLSEKIVNCFKTERKEFSFFQNLAECFSICELTCPENFVAQTIVKVLMLLQKVKRFNFI